MPRLPTWEGIVTSPANYIGGELIAQEGDDEFRGPVSAIESRGGLVIITCIWVATRKLALPGAPPQPWVLSTTRSFKVDPRHSSLKLVARDTPIAADTPAFRLSSGGSAVLAPIWSRDKLDPRTVAGHPRSSSSVA